MKTRWLILGGAAALVLALTAGLAYAAGNDHETAQPGTSTSWEAMDDWPGMQRMHEQMLARMPDEFRAQCEAMHEQVEQMMAGTQSMMGSSMGPGMMVGGMGPGMVGGSSGGHANHHGSPWER